MTIPSGWTSEYLYDGERFFLIREPSGCMVTVDFNVRGYRAGCFTTGPTIGKISYTGRAWRDRLVRDAVEWLTKYTRKREE